LVFDRYTVWQPREGWPVVFAGPITPDVSWQEKSLCPKTATRDHVPIVKILLIVASSLPPRQALR
jgi:hypothetical protein